MATRETMTRAEIEQRENRLARIGEQGYRAARAGLPLEKAPQEALQRSQQYARRMPGLTPQQRKDQAAEYRSWFLSWYYEEMADICHALAQEATEEDYQRRQASA